jgi:hypothetical protein
MVWLSSPAAAGLDSHTISSCCRDAAGVLATTLVEDRSPTTENDKFDKKNDNTRPSLSLCFLDIINTRKVMESSVKEDRPHPPTSVLGAFI